MFYFEMFLSLKNKFLGQGPAANPAVNSIPTSAPNPIQTTSPPSANANGQSAPQVGPGPPVVSGPQTTTAQASQQQAQPPISGMFTRNQTSIHVLLDENINYKTLALLTILAPNSQMPMPPHPSLPPQNNQPAYQQPMPVPVTGKTFCINLVLVHSVGLMCKRVNISDFQTNISFDNFQVHTLSLIIRNPLNHRNLKCKIMQVSLLLIVI